eukprot:TRINITY_DN8729_c3_g1_i3.p1 TRINITY_DN8729_c3_g1~~TRINITY_DN8729_c3_g1_i3.p1  ORF type:complete len:858 (+),score=108.10 TRINITY_DN8729_c3_g1_i3:56-2629(+)
MFDSSHSKGRTDGYSSSSMTPISVPPEKNYVGLVNQGATCYMNSLLQALFHLTIFKEGIFTLPRDEDRVVSALQQLFYRMEISSSPVSTEELTQSFGWDSYESYRQHDVQELLQVLVTGHIETCFKKNSEKGDDIISKNFRGLFTSYIRVTDPEVQYESNVDEPYIDIQLNVKNHDKSINGTLLECFRSFTVEDQLVGDNKYELEREGKRSLHDAAKGMRFKSFPDVLILHLKRFCQDLYGRAEKVCDEVKFEADLDLSEFTQDDSDNEFSLHAVMVHRGSTATMGHYYSFVNVGQEGWYKFDDSRVTKCTADDAILENYGSSGTRSWSSGYSSAYLLIYVRKSKLTDILQPESPHRCSKLKRQLKEKMTKEARERAPNEFADIILLTSEDYKERVSKNPITIDCFRDVNYKGAGMKLVCEKRKGVRGLKAAVVDALEVPDKLLSEMQLFKCTQSGLVLVEDECHGVGSRLDPGVFYIHPPTMKVDTNMYKRFTFLINFEDGKMHPHPDIIAPQITSTPASLGPVVVCYAIDGSPVPSIENLLVCVIESYEKSSFEEHQKRELNKKVITIQPVEHQTVAPFGHKPIRYNVLKTDTITTSDVLQYVASKVGVPPEFVVIHTKEFTTEQYKYEIWDFDKNIDTSLVVSPSFGAPNRVYVHVYGAKYSDYLGCHTIVVGGAPVSNDVESGLTQLPEDVLSKIPDGKLFITEMYRNSYGYGRRTMNDTPKVYCVRPIPHSRLTEERPKYTDHVQCCHYDYEQNALIGMPFPVHITLTSVPSDLLLGILEFIGVSKWTGPPMAELPCTRLTETHKPFPAERHSFGVSFPPAFPENSDGSEWTLIPLYTPHGRATLYPPYRNT